MELNRTTSACSLFAVAVALAASPAAAQDMQTDPASVEDVDNVIIVTAQLREQDIQDVPISITAITDDTLAAARIEDS